MIILNRRTLLTGLATTGLAVVAGESILAAPRRSFFARKGLPIGLQVYTLGDHAGRDLDATFAQIARIGYREIELPSLYGRPARQVGAAAGRAGLHIGSLHTPLGSMGGEGLSLSSEPGRIADALGEIGARWAVAPIMLMPNDFRPKAGESFGATISRSVAAAGEDVWKRSAALLNERAAALKPLGFRVGYHNHNLEFAPIGRTTGWEILARETDPGLVSFEIDVGWVAAAGLDPVRFLDGLRGRVRLLHVKDIAVGNRPNFIISMSPAEVGSGTLAWPRVLRAAYQAGVRHFYVEQEPPFTMPRIEAARRSYDYLNRLAA